MRRADEKIALGSVDLTAKGTVARVYCGHAHAGRHEITSRGLSCLGCGATWASAEIRSAQALTRRAPRRAALVYLDRPAEARP